MATTATRNAAASAADLGRRRRGRSPPPPRWSTSSRASAAGSTTDGPRPRSAPAPRGGPASPSANRTARSAALAAGRRDRRGRGARRLRARPGQRRRQLVLERSFAALERKRARVRGRVSRLSLRVLLREPDGLPVEAMLRRSSSWLPDALRELRDLGCFYGLLEVTCRACRLGRRRGPYRRARRLPRAARTGVAGGGRVDAVPRGGWWALLAL